MARKKILFYIENNKDNLLYFFFVVIFYLAIYYILSCIANITDTPDTYTDYENEKLNDSYNM